MPMLPPMLPKAALASPIPSAGMILPSSPGRHLVRQGAQRGDYLSFFVNGQTFASTYTLGEQIGAGGFGKVFKAQHKVLGFPRAVKRLKKLDGPQAELKTEIDTLMALDSPHIVRLVEFYDEDNYLYLVFALCRGPDLLDKIRKSPAGRLTEHDASIALRHMLKALQCCHSRYKGHYDIKPENFMYADEEADNLKMIDLGLSSGFDAHRRHKISGTLAYMAPEFFHGVYGPEGDVWSCGAVLFAMLTGTELLPEVPREIFRNEIKVRKLLRKALDDAARDFGLSVHAMDLLGQMLQHDRHGRPTVREALSHSFHAGPYAVERTQEVVWPKSEALLIHERLSDTFRAISREPMLKRVARLAIAHTGVVCKSCSLAFRMLDKHGYAALSISVFEKHFSERGESPPDDFEDLFEAIDLNRDGYIGYLTFLAAVVPKASLCDETLCHFVFMVFDRNKDGYIDPVDLAELCGHPVSEASGPPSSCFNALEEVCGDVGDLRVSWPMFFNLMRGSA